MQAILAFLATRFGPLILNLIFSFLSRQLKKFGSQLDLSKVRADSKIRIAKLIPGDAWDDLAVGAVDKCFDLVEEFLKQITDGAPAQEAHIDLAINAAHSAIYQSAKEADDADAKAVQEEMNREFHKEPREPKILMP
jgi:hypothetical protein